MRECVEKAGAQDRFLVYEAKQGWEPLCKFMGLPMPDAPFPFADAAKSEEQLEARRKMFEEEARAAKGV